jgi:adenylosuccinate synthase
MPRLTAVIGANYGDEGKGHVVDFLSRERTIVVRFNGGAEGLRHVFHHFGSATFGGMPTFLSRHFVCNPVLFRTELNEIRQKGFVPRVSVDPLSPVTTPWDMMLNQAAEAARGENRHGSCGAGINETITRGEAGADFEFLVGDILGMDAERILRGIRDEWLPVRARELGLDPLTVSPWANSSELFARFLQDLRCMSEAIAVVPWSEVNTEDVVFEGAQGIGLDQGHWHFPHVTRSNTGLLNVQSLIQEAGLENEGLKVVYVTRPYVTRHGVGPLERECTQAELGPRVVDDTNVPNPHQGTLRWAHFDLDAFDARIEFDLANVELDWVEPWVALTCADQMDEFTVFDGEGPRPSSFSAN